MARRPLLPASLAVVLSGAALAVLPAGAAVASPATSPTTIAELQTDLSTCAGTEAAPYTETLTQDLSGTTSQLTVGCVVMLDLDGHNVSVRNIVVGSDRHLTVDDSSTGTPGTLTADASASQAPMAGIQTSGAALTVAGGTVQAKGSASDTGAGIGANLSGAGVGSILITGGHVNATAGDASAGIGGADQSTAGGQITISGGTVVAAGTSNGGAGIGGAYRSATPPVLITGGSVTATSSVEGAAIGSGKLGAGAVVTITDGTVLAMGGNFGTGIGNASGSPTAATIDISGGTVTATGGIFAVGIGSIGNGGGQVTISGGTVSASGGRNQIGGVSPDTGHVVVSGGTLRLPSGTETISDNDTSGPELSISGSGRVTGSDDATPTYASFTGEGQIQNDGVIDMPADDVSVSVTHRDYLLTFDTGGVQTDPPSVKVFAGTVANGGRTLPDPGAHMQWAAPDGTPVGATTDLTQFGEATAGPLVVQLQAVPAPQTLTDVQDDLRGCTGTEAAPTTVTLSSDLSGTATELTVNCAATLDLAGHSLAVRDVLISQGQHLTVSDSSTGAGGSLVADAESQAGATAICTAGSRLTVTGGSVEADSGSDAAGIGTGRSALLAACPEVTPGLVDVSGGTVIARGDGYGAGIGSAETDSGPVTITGGTVTATGGTFAAGIGTGGAVNGAAVGPVTISGGSVTATAPYQGSGIGGGTENSGGEITISGGDVTASSAVYSAVGSIGRGSVFGHLTVSGGVLHLPSGKLYVPDDDTPGPEITVSGDGVITGSAGAAPTYATVVGGLGVPGIPATTGQIQNDARILLPAEDVTVPVTHRHYAVSFPVGAGTPAAGSPTSVGVFADNFADGDRGFPADPTPPTGQQFTGWVAALPDGSQLLVDSAIDLTRFGSADDATAAAGVPVAVVATYRAAPRLTGVVEVGKLLTAHQPVSAYGSPAVTYQWIRTRNSVSTVVATGSTYRLTSSDLGGRVRVLTRVVQDQRDTTTQVSAPTAAVAPGTLQKPLSPVIKFPPKLHPRVGGSLVAAFAHGVPQGHVTGLTHHFQWYAGTTEVGADRPRLTLTDDMVGKRLHLVVTYTAPGYEPVSVTSNTTRTVRA